MKIEKRKGENHEMAQSELTRDMAVTWGAARKWSVVKGLREKFKMTPLLDFLNTVYVGSLRRRRKKVCKVLKIKEIIYLIYI